MNVELEYLIYNYSETGYFFAPVNENMQHTEYRLTFSQFKEPVYDTGTLAIVFYVNEERSADTPEGILSNRAAPTNDGIIFSTNLKLHNI